MLRATNRRNPRAGSGCVWLFDSIARPEKREGLRAGAAEFLGDSDFEASRILEQFAEDRRGASPVVAVLARNDEGLDFGGRFGRLRSRLLHESRHSNQEEKQERLHVRDYI